MRALRDGCALTDRGRGVHFGLQDSLWSECTKWFGAMVSKQYRRVSVGKFRKVSRCWTVRTLRARQ